MLALSKGLSVDQAAAAARNITVNFEKAGTMLKSARLPDQTDTETVTKGFLQVFQAAYLFIRPALQGGRKFVQRFNTEKGRTSLAFSAMLSIASNIATILANYEEGEEELKNIYQNKYAVENYFHVPLGKGAGVKIPKPYSPDKPLSTMITRTFGAKYTGDTPADIMADGVMGTLKLMLPLDITRAGSGMFDPTIAQPFGDIYRNKTYYGGAVLRNERDPKNSFSDEMLLGTTLFGQKISDSNIFTSTSAFAHKVFKPETGSYFDKLISPQGIEHLVKGYFTDKGILAPVTKAGKALSKKEADKLRRDESLSEGRIKLIQFGKAVKYLEFDAGKVALANNFFNATKSNINTGIRVLSGTEKALLENKVIKLQNIEDSFNAAVEIGLVDNDGARKMYKTRITNWFKENSGRNGISEGLFREIAPNSYYFVNSTDLNQKAIQQIMDREQFRSLKRIELLKTSGKWDELDADEQAMMINKAQAYELELRRNQWEMDDRDSEKAEDIGRINAWWEDLFGIDDN